MRAPRPRKKKLRILIADREGVFRLGLKKLFALEDDLRVVAEAETGPQALVLAKSFNPDLLFIQAEILAGAATNLIAQLARASRPSKIVVTTSNLAGEEAVGHVEAGASGVILRSVAPPLFIKCVRKVMDNEVWLPKREVAHMAKRLETNPQRPLRPAETLTRREKTVITCLMQGWRNREIANHLSVTEQTVKNHLRTIYDKLGVSDRLELVLYAIHQHLELPPAMPSGTPS